MLRFTDDTNDTAVLVDLIDEDDDLPRGVNTDAAAAAAAIAADAIRNVLNVPGGSSRPDEPAHRQSGRGQASIRVYASATGIVVHMGPTPYPYMWIHQHTGREFVRTALVPIAEQLEEILRRHIA